MDNLTNSLLLLQLKDKADKNLQLMTSDIIFNRLKLIYLFLAINTKQIILILLITTIFVNYTIIRPRFLMPK